MTPERVKELKEEYNGRFHVTPDEAFELLNVIEKNNSEMDSLRSRLADLEARSRWVSEVPREG